MDPDTPGLFRATSRRRERRGSDCDSSIDVLLKCRIWILKSGATHRTEAGRASPDIGSRKYDRCANVPCFLPLIFHSSCFFFFLATFPLLRLFPPAETIGDYPWTRYRWNRQDALSKRVRGLRPDVSNFLLISFGTTLLTLRSSSVTESLITRRGCVHTLSQKVDWWKKMSRWQERCLRTRYPVRECINRKKSFFTAIASLNLSFSLSVKIPFLSRPPRLRRPYPQSVDFDKGFKFQGEKRRKIRDSRDGVT